MSKLKSGLTFLCLMLLVMGLSACGSAGASSGSEIGLLDKKVLKVGMEVGYPPFEFYSDDGVTPTGLDVELAKEIGKILGVEVKYEDTAWDGIFSGLDINKYDVIMSAVTIKPDRAEVMDFSTPYIENWQCIVVKSGSEPITSVAGLNGLNVGLQSATTSDDLMSEWIATGVVSCTVSGYDKVLNAFEELRLGRVDAVLTDSTVADSYLSRDPGEYEITWLQSSEPGAEAEKFGVAVKKGNAALLKAINDALKTLEDNGTLDALRAAWLS